MEIPFPPLLANENIENSTKKQQNYEILTLLADYTG